MKYYCTNCGAEFLKWSGKCSNCGQWDSLAEIPAAELKSKNSSTKKSSGKVGFEKPVALSQFKKDYDPTKFDRFSSGFKELDRVLGGGIVIGSIVLIAGEPGVGKSTLLTQVIQNLSASKRILYVSGEESVSQIYSRFSRINNKGEYSNESVLLSNETNVEAIMEMLDGDLPEVLIVDSIQSLYSDTVKSIAGSIGQVRVVGSLLTRIAKDFNIPVLVVGQINKDGNVAGPKVLEHVVDTVLYLEGAEFNVFRILRSIKNRFGSTNEIGVFEMTSSGMIEVADFSKVFVDKEISNNSGVAIGATLQGSRIVFVEVQALVVDRGMESGPLRRVANGIRKPRLDMLCAVISKKAKAFLGDKDVFVNVVGGMNIDDPAIDLAVCAAIESAVWDKVVDLNKVFYGEVGLTGEIRSGIGVDAVLNEAKKVGYKGVVLGNSYKGASKFVQKTKDISSLV
ncbi:MAG TPA: DNA repair protein RadA [Candidatus Dojkabacteria bacterium]|nr:DNA repair protein RadA [Candidatus Dojkabacteria bacterium]